MASKKSEPGIYASLVLPTLVIGTVGGGTQVPTAKESLSMIGCFGKVTIICICFYHSQYHT